MLFEVLDKIKRNAIFSTILLLALGAAILLCPNETEYINLFILGMGYTLAVISLVMFLNFFSSEKALVDYIKFVLALVLAFIGIANDQEKEEEIIKTVLP